MNEKNMGDVKCHFDVIISKNMSDIVTVYKKKGKITQEKIAEEISHKLKELPAFPKNNLIDYSNVKIHKSNFSKHLKYHEQWNDNNIESPQAPNFPEICAFCALFNIEVSKLLNLTNEEIDKIVNSKINSTAGNKYHIGIKYSDEPINYEELKKAKKSIFISGIVVNIMNDGQFLNILSEISPQVEIILSVPKYENDSVMKSITQFFSLSESEYKTKRYYLEQQIKELNRKRKVKEKKDINIINVDIFTPVSYVAIDYEKEEITEESFIQAKHYILRRIDDIHYSAYYVTINSKVNPDEFAYYQEDIILIKSTNGKLAERFQDISAKQQEEIELQAKSPLQLDNRQIKIMSRFSNNIYYAYYYDTDEKGYIIKNATIKTKSIKNSEFIEVTAIFSKYTYSGTLRIEHDYIFINLDADYREEKCLIILKHHFSANPKYLGGLGCVLSISTGRNVRPCFQNIFVSDIKVSADHLTKLNYLFDIKIEKNMIEKDDKIKIKKILFDPLLDSMAYNEIKQLHDFEQQSIPLISE